VIAQLRKLLLGETWTLPLGVAVTLVAALALDAARPAWWERGGGFVLLGAVLATLVVSLRRPPGQRGRRVRSGGGESSGGAFGRATRRLPGSSK
jgi:hypothetical protein